MRPETKPRSRIWLWVALAILASAPLYEQPMALSSAYDWRYFLSWIEIGRRTIAWWHELPLWNPYGCGGMPHLANPQSIVASPTMLLAIAFGTGLGAKLMVTFYLFAAFDGMHRLARHEGLSPLGAHAAAILFGAGGWLAIRLGSGHINFAGAALFPYLALAYHHAKQGWAWTLGLGAIAAWIVALGGTSTPAMAAVLLSTLAGIDVVRTRSVRPLGVLLFGACVALVLGAARILPALEFAIDHPRRQWETDGNMIWEIVRNGWWWRGVEPTPGKRYWFHEYGYRMPILAAPLALWAIRVRHVRRYWIVMAVGAAIVAGSAIPYGPWWLLKHLPIFRDLRVPARYSVMLAFALPILCGAALDDLRTRYKLRPSVQLALVAILSIDALAYDWARFSKLFTTPMPEVSKADKFFHVRGDWSQMLPITLQNRGDIKCDEEAPLTRARSLDLGDVPQVRLEDPTSGVVEPLAWSPNRISARVALARQAVVLFNSNWNEHWKSTAGEIVKVGDKVEMDRDGGRLGVRLPPGSHEVAVYYRPRSFVVGAWVSVVSWLLAAVYLLRAARSTKARQPPSIDVTSV